MKPFRFRLETLLRLREADRDARRMELAQALVELQHLQAKQQAVELQLSETRSQDRTLRQSATFSLELLRQAEALRQSLAAASARLSAELAAAGRQVEACQQRLAAAECDFQAVTKLREARQTEHRRVVLRQEAKLADESAGYRHRRVA